MHIVMAGLVPAIHVFAWTNLKDVDARDERGHNEMCNRHDQRQAADYPCDGRVPFGLRRSRAI